MMYGTHPSTKPIQLLVCSDCHSWPDQWPVPPGNALLGCAFGAWADLQTNAAAVPAAGSGKSRANPAGLWGRGDHTAPCPCASLVFDRSGRAPEAHLETPHPQDHRGCSDTQMSPCSFTGKDGFYLDCSPEIPIQAEPGYWKVAPAPVMHCSA